MQLAWRSVSGWVGGSTFSVAATSDGARKEPNRLGIRANLIARARAEETRTYWWGRETSRIDGPRSLTVLLHDGPK
eukprot:2479572-Pyramimonas_sp.AAC.1